MIRIASLEAIVQALNGRNVKFLVAGGVAVLPFDFEEAYMHAAEEPLAPGLGLRFVPIDLLIAMKAAAGRPRDLDDIEHLRQLQEIRAQRHE